MTTKKLEFGDVLDVVRDETVNREFHTHQDGPGLTGIVTMRDDSGRVVFEKRHNLIVLRGRTFALERLFGDSIGTNGVTGGVAPYLSDINRTIVAFGVGRGGAPVSDPFSPYAPPPTGSSGVALASPVPFRLHDTAAQGDGDPATFIPASEIGNYGGGQAVSGHATQTQYFMKEFDTTPAWFFDEATNTVYKQIELSISATDCRTASSNWINELCLYFARKDVAADPNGAVNFINAEMMSRITFSSEYLGPNKSLQISYRVYA
jgi:hypothetical protein